MYIVDIQVSDLFPVYAHPSSYLLSVVCVYKFQQSTRNSSNYFPIEGSPRKSTLDCTFDFGCNVADSQKIIQVITHAVFNLEAVGLCIHNWWNFPTFSLTQLHLEVSIVELISPALFFSSWD